MDSHDDDIMREMMRATLGAGCVERWFDYISLIDTDSLYFPDSRHVDVKAKSELILVDFKAKKITERRVLG